MAEYIYGFVPFEEIPEFKMVRREEVVRCRDCKRFSVDNSDHDYRSGWWCKRWNTDIDELRKLMARMAEALGIDCEWADPNWCKSPCVLEFGCWPNEEHAEIRCPAWAAMRELGVEVDG